MALMEKRSGPPTSEEYSQYAVWFNPKLKNKKLFPYWRICFELFRALSFAPIDIRDRMGCYRCLKNWTYNKRFLLRFELVFHARKLLASKQ